MKKLMFVGLVLTAAMAGAEQVVDISGVGNRKFTVSVDVSHPMFAKCLQKNLELSGVFQVNKSGSVKVTGAPGAIVAEGSGKRLSSAEAFSDDKAARMAAALSGLSSPFRFLARRFLSRSLAMDGPNRSAASSSTSSTSVWREPSTGRYISSSARKTMTAVTRSMGGDAV